MTPAARSFVIFVCAIILAATAALAFIVNTNEKSDDIKALTEQVVQVGERIEDCSSATGRCYQENQARTGAAIQTLLESFKQQLDPHRLRNEAENLCLLYAFAGPPPNRVADKPLEEAVAFYKQCVLDRSGGTEPPPLPPNPYVTTTTRRGQP